MKSKVLSTLALSAIAPLSSAAQDTDEQLQQLQAETAVLRQQVQELQQQAVVKRSRSDLPEPGPHFGIDASFDGKRLLINEPSLNKDLNLLLQKKYLNNTYGSVADHGARVMLSGTVGASAYQHSNAFAADESLGKSDVTANAELDIAAQLNDWWTAYSKFDGSTPENNIAFNQGFITFGNLQQIPLYATAGLFYMPNGSYSSRMLSKSLPRLLARTRGKGLSLGYADDQGLRTALFALSGETRESNDQRFDEWGANFAYDADNLKFAVSYMNNIASSDGMETAFSEGTRLEKYISAANVRGSVKVAAVSLAAEYVAAVEDFSSSDLVKNGDEKVKPSAMLLEAAYQFRTFGKQSYVASSYGHSKSALALKLPKYQYGATYSINFYKNTVLYLELLRKRDYPLGDTAQAKANTLVAATGTTDTVVSAEIDVYF